MPSSLPTTTFKFTAVGLLLFLAGLGLTILPYDRIANAFVESYIVRYEVMADINDDRSETYTVVHSNLVALNELAGKHPDLVRLESSILPRTSMVSINNSALHIVDKIKALPDVSFVLKTSIPLLCH